MRYFLPGEKPFETLPKFTERYAHLWLGVIRRYDQDNETCDVEWINLPGGRTAVPFSLALSGRRAFLGGPPEEGSLVFCDWIPQTAMGLMSPVIVAYAHTGFENQRLFNLTRDLTDPPTFYGRRVKTPKLYQGDLAMVSAPGSHAIADEDLSLASASLTEILLRSSDLAIIHNALQHYVEGAGVRSRMGMVERSNLGQDSDPLLEDDRLAHYVTQGQDASRLEFGGKPWAEMRWEVRETSDGTLAVPETLFGNKTVDRKWLVQQVMGVLVGDNPKDTARYGKALVRKILAGSTISRDYAIADATTEVSATSIWHISVPNGSDDPSPTTPNATVDLDRAGRLAISLSKTSSGHPAGEGKSLQLALDGSVNASIGQESSGNLSTNIHMTGKHHIEIAGGSEVEVTGNSLHQVNGQYDLNVTGVSNIGGSIVFLGGSSGTQSGRPF